MNRYEKLTVERFSLNLTEGKYSGLTGARRAIGRVDWTDAEKVKANKLADAHFGNAAPAAHPAKRATPKKVARKLGVKAKKAARRSAAAKPAQKASAHPPGYDEVAASVQPLVGLAPLATSTPSTDTITTVRQQAAATAMMALTQMPVLGPDERRTFDLARRSYEANTELELASPKRIPAAPASGTRRAPVTQDLGEDEATPALTAKDVVAPPGGAPRIPVTSSATTHEQPAASAGIKIPDIDPDTLDPDERRTHDRLVKAANAVNAQVQGSTSAG